MTSDNRFRIGFFHPSSTSLHLLSPLARQRNLDVLDPRAHLAVMRATEGCELDYVFLADGWGGRGPISEEGGYSNPMLFAPTLAGLLIGASYHIKIITTMHQAWFHPLHIARMGANLDALSGGRWGMNAVSGAGFAPDLVRSVSVTTDHDALYDAASESMEILIQAWSDGGRVDFRGKYFEASGRLTGPSAVQRPHPMIVSAGASPRGCEFAGRYASVVFIPGRSTPKMIADRRAQIMAAAERAGRGDTEIKVLLHASIIIGESSQQADELSEELRESVDFHAVHEYLKGVTQISTYEDLFAEYTEDQLRDVGHTAGTIKIHGDAHEVADGIAALRENTGCDGVSLSFPIWRPENIEKFGRSVAPLLEKRGVWSRASNRGWAW